MNLSALTNNNDLKNKLAGYSAKSSSNPYPKISLGNKYNQAKTIKDANSFVKNSLNPEFYKLYEFEANFPENSLLEIALYEYRTISQDDLIGSVRIDLEDRLFESSKRRQYLALEKRKKLLKQELKTSSENEQIDNIKKALDETNTLLKESDLNFIKENCIEFLNIKQDELSYNSGTLEVILDVMTP